MVPVANQKNLFVIFCRLKGTINLLKLILVCAKCKKETMSFDDGEGILIINFETSSVDFFCPKCGKENKLNLGDIKEYLKQKTGLPGIKGM